MSYEGEFSHYETEVADSGAVQIFEKSNLVFCSDYTYVNGKKYSYDSFTATVNSVRVLNQVQLSVIFEFGDYLCATARLDKNILAILKRFPVKVTNDGALKLLLTDKLNAFTQVLKYGRIIKIFYFTKIKCYNIIKFNLRRNYGKKTFYCRQLEDEHDRRKRKRTYCAVKTAD